VNTANVIALVLGLMSIVGVPMLVFLIRMTARWTRVENDLSTLARDMRNLVENKDQTHAAMLDTMREDRAVTDRRLRWLEENIWNRGTRKDAA
jgi:biopolymer transport protein ExbB/TolQ